MVFFLCRVMLNRIMITVVCRMLAVPRGRYRVTLTWRVARSL